MLPWMVNCSRLQSVADIVGKTFSFQLKLGEFIYTSKHQTFRISRIITETQRAPLPDFVGNVSSIEILESVTNIQTSFTLLFLY